MKQITRGLPLCLLAGGLISLAGCSWDPPINVTKKENLKRGQLYWFVEESDPSSQRRINVTMEPFPKDAEVAVALVYKQDLDKAKEALKKGEEPPAYLRSHVGGGAVKFEPTIIKKGQPFAVVVFNKGEDSAEMVLKITAK
jgi:hypothetical protein